MLAMLRGGDVGKSMSMTSLTRDMIACSTTVASISGLARQRQTRSSRPSTEQIDDPVDGGDVTALTMSAATNSCRQTIARPAQRTLPRALAKPLFCKHWDGRTRVRTKIVDGLVLRNRTGQDLVS